MDADATGEFQDWEVLHSSSDSESSAVNQADPVHNLNDFEAIDDQSEGMIQTDYFSIDPLRSGYTRTVAGADVGEVGSENSDIPSWVDPGLETQYPRKDAGGSWTDSGSDRSDDRKFNELEGKSAVGSDGNGKLLAGFEGIEEIRGGHEKTLDGIELDSLKVGNLEQHSLLGSKEIANLETLGEEKRQIECENDGESVEVEAKNVEQKEEDEKKKSVVWWKVPIDFLRYCVFRASPVWTFSVAAAALGFVILGRRLYKMKKKTRGLELKVTLDDKVILLS